MSGKKEKPKQRLSSDERREAILNAAVPVFAEVGFQGTTTKMLAAHLGISEALLYQHFPSKEALYAAVQEHLCVQHLDLREALAAIEPSTEHLVFILYLFAQMVIDPPAGFDIGKTMPRVMLQSMLSDGEFARMHIAKNMTPLMDIVSRSISAARACGDLLVNDDIGNEYRFWLAHNVLIMIHLGQIPEKPLHDYYPKDKNVLIDHAMRFMLRGMGITNDAVARVYDQKRLRAAMGQFICSKTRIPSPED